MSEVVAEGPWRFEVQGLPYGTGLVADNTTGALVGTPTNADARASLKDPLSLTIAGANIIFSIMEPLQHYSTYISVCTAQEKT